MSFSIINLDSGARVSIGGNLDGATLPGLRMEVASLLGARPAVVELDLSHLRFVDNAGLGVILSFIKRLYAQGGALVLPSVEAQPLALFELLQLAHVDPEAIPRH
jgi:anti-anti-sigma factor